MASTIEQIRTLLGIPQTKMYAELRLDDGRVVVTEADDFAEGSDLRVIGEDGSTTQLSAGQYKTADGEELTVDNDSKLAHLKTEKMPGTHDEKELEEEKKQEDMNYEKVKAALMDELDLEEEVAKKVAAVAAAVYAKEMAEEEEEKKMEKPDHKDEDMEEEKKKEEMSSVMAQMAEQLADINHRLQKFEEAPAAEGVDTTPQVERKSFNPQLQGIDRMLSYFNSTK